MKSEVWPNSEEWTSRYLLGRKAEGISGSLFRMVPISEIFFFRSASPKANEVKKLSVVTFLPESSPKTRKTNAGLIDFNNKHITRSDILFTIKTQKIYLGSPSDLTQHAFLDSSLVYLRRAFQCRAGYYSSMMFDSSTGETT